MKTKYVARILIGLFVVLFGTVAITIVPKRMDANAGVIHFPFYQRTQTMDATRDMIYALGWNHKSEGGNGKKVTFEAEDLNGKLVTFDFIYKIASAKVMISVEDSSQYPAKEITKELARCIGMHIDGERLEKVK